MKKEKIIIRGNFLFNAKGKKNQRKRDIMYKDKEKKNKKKNNDNIS